MVDQKLRSRIRGAIIGTAIGDAFGMPVEGMKPEDIVKHFGRLTSMKTPKFSALKRGQFTDDTQLMLAIGESIVAKGMMDYDDIAQRHILFMNERHNRGWGNSTITGVGRIKAGTSWWNSGVKDGAGNGIPMKIAPLGVLLALKKIDMFEARTAVINISRMTHGDPRPAVAGIVQMEAIASAIENGPAGLDVLEVSQGCAGLLEFMLDDRGSRDPFHKSLGRSLTTALQSLKKPLNSIRNMVGAGCYVVESYPFTVAAVLKYRKNPEKCLIELANQGGDADTTCAMAGALMGAAYGLSAFPERWRRPLEGYQRLLALADGLYNLQAPTQSFGQRPKIMFSRKEIKNVDQVKSNGNVEESDQGKRCPNEKCSQELESQSGRLPVVQEAP